jgi:hypothetical protein
MPCQGHKMEYPRKQSRDLLLEEINAIYGRLDVMQDEYEKWPENHPFRKKVEAAHQAVCIEAVNLKKILVDISKP